MQTPYRKLGKYALQPNDPYLSQDKFLSLQKDLEQLLKQRPFLASEVGRLAELGDFSENVEYQLAKGKLRGLNSAISKIENQLRNAVVINNKDNKHFVDLGSIVIVRVNGKAKQYEILGSSESDPDNGVISHTSPIGQILMGKIVGEKVVLKLKDREVEYEILEIK